MDYITLVGEVKSDERRGILMDTVTMEYGLKKIKIQVFTTFSLEVPRSISLLVV